MKKKNTHDMKENITTPVNFNQNDKRNRVKRDRNEVSL